MSTSSLASEMLSESPERSLSVCLCICYVWVQCMSTVGFNPHNYVYPSSQAGMHAAAACAQVGKLHRQLHAGTRRAKHERLAAGLGAQVARRSEHQHLASRRAHLCRRSSSMWCRCCRCVCMHACMRRSLQQLLQLLPQAALLLLLLCPHPVRDRHDAQRHRLDAPVAGRAQLGRARQQLERRAAGDVVHILCSRR